MQLLDPFDPNNWPHFIGLPHEFRIYGDDRAHEFCVVDEVDYHWAIRWRWHVNKPHPKRNGKKRYFCRNQSNAARYLPTLYLHVEIMKRTGIVPTSDLHFLVDHADGDELNCRRANLRWATRSFNNRNINGSHESILV